MEGHRNHVDANTLVLQPMTANVGGGQFGDSPLLGGADGLGGVAVGGVGSGANLDKDNSPAVEGDDVDVASKNPFPATDDSVALPFEVANGLILGPSPQFIPRRGHGEPRQALAAAFLRPRPLPSLPPPTSSRFSLRRVALPERSRR